MASGYSQAVSVTRLTAVKRLLVPLAAGVAAAVLTGGAGATIVPQKGMAGVRLGMTPAKVRSVLGTPLATIHGTNDFGPFTELRYAHRVVVSFQGDLNVTSVTTTARFERTSGGLGVGSTKAQVIAGLPAVTCESFPGGSLCYLGRLLPGKRATTFLVKNGHVTRVTVGFVID